MQSRIVSASSVGMLIAGLTLAMAASADVAAGKAKWDAACADCHEVGEFAGKPVVELEKTMKDVASGAIKHKKKVALTEAEAKALAAYLAAAK